ncbi:MULTISPECIES: hypothetical protein [Amycolatopsis]|uniref:hypothetical protein n=1 Tax=Amycolatopsis TaxID=1813 RepID=UPI00174CAC10|nr:hypothetical protein [Amycolatopsis bullii]
MVRALQRGAGNSAVARVLVQRMSASELQTLEGDFGPVRVREALQRLGQTAEDAKAAEVRAACEADPFGSAGDAAQRKFRWASSGDSDWAKYLRGEVSEPGSMNCWEYLLFVAVRTGQLSRPELVRLYTDADGFVNAEKESAAQVFAGSETDLLNDYGALSIGDAIVFDIPERHVALSLGGGRVADMGGRYEEVSEVDLGDLVAHQHTRIQLDGLYSHLSLVMDEENRKAGGEHKNVNDVYDFREYVEDGLGHNRDKPLPRSLMDYVEDCAAEKAWSRETKQFVQSVVSRVSVPPLHRIPKAIWIARVKSYVPPTRL